MSETNTGQATAIALFREARGLFGDGKYSEALAKVESCLRSQYELPQGWLLRGRTLAKLQNFDEAAISFRRSAIAGAADPQWQCNVAREFMGLGRFPMAAAILRLALTQGESTEALNLMSEIQASQGQFARARANAERALEIEPNNTLSQALLANIIGNKERRTRFTRDDVEAGRAWALRLEGAPRANTQS